MHVTLGEAARQSGISKSTISRAIRDGKLSGVRSPDTGSYRIEQSELERYLSATAVVRATAATEAQTSAATQPATVEELPNPAALQAQIDGLKQLLQQMETRITEKDALLAKQDARIEKILTALPAPKVETPAPAPEVSRLRATWRWLRSTG